MSVYDTLIDFLNFLIIYSDVLWLAFLKTLQLSVIALAMGFFIGVFTALFKLSTTRLLRWPATLFVETFRNTPLLVQLLAMSYAYPPLVAALFGVTPEPNSWTNPSSFWDAIIILSLNTGAYQAEIIRSGVQSIPSGQMEAARSLGLNYTKSMRYIVLPQTFRVILPPMANEFIILVLNSSLAAVISVNELTFWGQRISSETFRVLEIWFIIGLIYLVITLSLSRGFQQLEEKVKIPGLGI